MPRINPGRLKKMLKNLNNPSTVTVAAVPEDAFAPEARLEVPAGAFDEPKAARRFYPAYVRYRAYDNAGKQYEYSTFVFTVKYMRDHFKDYADGQRYRLVQGKAPHNDWFMLEPTTNGGGNEANAGGVHFNTKHLVDMPKDEAFPLETVVKNNRVYVKLPSELVPLLRKG
jgi:hypothetical protein